MRDSVYELLPRLEVKPWNVKYGDEPAWYPERCRLDLLDDGYGPYMDWLVASPEEHKINIEKYSEFRAWAMDYFGQGYSLACYDGRHVDITVSYAWRAWKAAKGWQR